MFGRNPHHDPETLRAATDAWMRELADTSVDAPHPLPDPGVVWWKAQLLRRWESERRAVVPIERMHWVELAAGAASLGVFLVWQWSGLVNLLSRLSPSALATLASSSSSSPASAAAEPATLIFAVGVTLALGATIFASLHRMLTRD
jgi:hypothetical protein